MKTFRFYGNSDDTFGEYGVTKQDFDNCANGTPIRFKLQTHEVVDGEPEESLGVVITGCYGSESGGRVLGGGCWMIGVEGADEGRIPNWPMRLVPEHGYSQALEIDAPDHAVLTLLNPRRGE